MPIFSGKYCHGFYRKKREILPMLSESMHSKEFCSQYILLFRNLENRGKIIRAEDNSQNQLSAFRHRLRVEFSFSSLLPLICVIVARLDAARQISSRCVLRARETFLGLLHLVSHRPVACVIKLDRLTISMSMNSAYSLFLSPSTT